MSRVQERVKNALSRTLYTFLSKYIFFFFPKACTRIFNNINFGVQGLQIGAFHQRYLKCKCETPYFESEIIPTPKLGPNRVDHSFQNCFDTGCQNCMVWSSGGCLCPETA